MMTGEKPLIKLQDQLVSVAARFSRNVNTKEMVKL